MVAFYRLCIIVFNLLAFGEGLIADVFFHLSVFCFMGKTAQQ